MSTYAASLHLLWRCHFSSLAVSLLRRESPHPRTPQYLHTKSAGKVETARTLKNTCSIMALSDATLSETTMKVSATMKTADDKTSSLQAANTVQEQGMVNAGGAGEGAKDVLLVHHRRSTSQSCFPGNCGIFELDSTNEAQEKE